MAPLRFHTNTGSMVTLSNDNKTAHRNHPHQEFNNGLVMSGEPLRDNQLFEVRIDKKVSAWSGSIEIGVTTLDPKSSTFPSSATNLREGSWVMSGNSVLQDGRAIMEDYGTDLDQLMEGDRVGVMRTTAGKLHFFINGVNQGFAASSIPQKIFGVVDMYGRCAQITVLDSTEARLMANDISNENIAAAYNQAVATRMDEKLRFHHRCGSLIKLSTNGRTAERLRPVDEFNNGVVMTHRPLNDDEIFEIRIDELVNKWSGSIEMGVTTHDPDALDFPATMTNMRSGTIMMSGSGILTNGKGTRREYGEFNLDELHEGDRIGLMRKSNGNLHYYINGLDQGIAATNAPPVIYGVVDLYGMTVKVTVLDYSEPSTPDLAEVHRAVLDNAVDSSISPSSDAATSEKLLFHSRCGSHAAVINGGLVAHRPNALDDFNNAVVLTIRPLRQGEMFEIEIEKLVAKWAGSIEIGVTTHSPQDLEFPSTMTNIRSGTWMMTGNGIMYNGTTIIDEYGHNLDRLKVGDKIGVLRTPNGTLHFYVNGIDQGPAATNVPDKVYGVIDLYGQASQASITQQPGPVSTNSIHSTSLTLNSDLRFHHIHGRNARLLNYGTTAVRPNAQGEFNDAILVSNRPLKPNEMFEVVIEQMVDRWSGSIEAGVTSISPEEIKFPSTMTDIDHDTWMLSGSSIMQNGSNVRHGYACDLDQLRVGSRIGMMRHADATLHYYVNGEDQGTACYDIPSVVFAVIDLYGQCAQVSIVHPSQFSPSTPSDAFSAESLYLNAPLSNEIGHHFSPHCGKNIILRGNMATRNKSCEFGTVFSSLAVSSDEIFEIQVERIHSDWAGGLSIGFTTCSPSPTLLLPSCAIELSAVKGDMWLVTGNCVYKNGSIMCSNYGPSLDRLCVGDRIGIRRSMEGNLHVHWNGEDLGVASSNIPMKPHVVIDVFGSVETISICSGLPRRHYPQENENFKKELPLPEFHLKCGRNVRLLNGNTSARRVSGYNRGLVMLNWPITRGHLFQFRIDKLKPEWSSSLHLGVISQHPDKTFLPFTVLNLKPPNWTVIGDSVFHNNIKIKSRYGPNLDSLQAHHLVGILVDWENRLHLYVNGIDQGIAAKEIPSICYLIVDLYGQCEQISLVTDDVRLMDSDNQEKADKENDVTEKPEKLPLPVMKNCEYQNTCVRIKSLMGLPDGYFNHETNVCYCDTCHKIRGDEPYYNKGDPPQEYALPFGWCRFTLRTKSDSVHDKWHVAFQGTKIASVRRILDSGELLPQGDLGLSPLTRVQGKTKDKDCAEISVSPTLRYAGSKRFSPLQEFVDPKTQKTLQVCVAFQVYIRPGAYTVGPQRLGAREPIDLHFSNSSIEWHSKEQGATVLHSLLVRLEGL